MRDEKSPRRVASQVHLAVLGILGASAGMDVAHAQQAGSEEMTLDEIQVTATRFSESLSDVPISISAYDTEALDTAGVKDFADIARLTPGVAFNAGNNTIAIRGISSSAGAATTGVYIDETPIQIRQFGTQPSAGLPKVFDLERVEILRGPQGTLYGAGSQGGTVRFITPTPSLNEYSVYGRGEVSFTEAAEPSYESGLALGGPIVKDKLGFRISGYNRRDGGWVDRIDYHNGQPTTENANWSNVSSLRGALLWKPVEGLEISPSVFWQDYKQNDTSGFNETWSNVSSHKFLNSDPVRTPNTDHFTLPSLKIQYDFGPALLVSNTSYFDRHQTTAYDGSIWRLGNLQQTAGFQLLNLYGPDDDVGVPDFQSWGWIVNRQKNISQEIRLQSANADSRLTWVIGAFYSKAKQRNIEAGESGTGDGTTDYDRLYQKLYGKTVEEFDGFPLFYTDVPHLGYYSFITDTRAQDKQLAGFLDVTFKITPSLSVAAGVRASDSKFSFVAARGSMTQADWTYNDGGSKEKPVSPRFGVSWHVTDDLMLYANAAKGFRNGGANSSSIIDRCAVQIAELGLGDIASYGPDTVWSYDVGAKGSGFGGRLAYDVGAYRIDWKGIQQSNSLTGCGLSYIGNFGDARAQGFDLTTQARLTRSLTVDFTAGHLNAEYLKKVMSSPAANASTLINDGNSLPSVTPWTFTLAPTLSFPLMGHDAFIRAQWEHGSEQNDLVPGRDPATSQYNPVNIAVEATDFVRLSTGINFEKMQVSLFADNLLDSAPTLSRSGTGGRATLGIDSYTYFRTSTWRPRTIGVTLVYRP